MIVRTPLTARQALETFDGVQKILPIGLAVHPAVESGFSANYPWLELAGVIYDNEEVWLIVEWSQHVPSASVGELVQSLRPLVLGSDNQNSTVWLLIDGGIKAPLVGAVATEANGQDSVTLLTGEQTYTWDEDGNEQIQWVFDEWERLAAP